MITRAKKTITLIISTPPETLPHGHLKNYLKDNASYERTETDHTTKRDWTNQLKTELQNTEHRTLTNYKTGDYHIDLAIGNDENATTIETTVSEQGSKHHTERRLALQRAGRDIINAYQSKWFLQPEHAAIRILTQHTLKTNNNTKNKTHNKTDQ